MNRICKQQKERFVHILARSFPIAITMITCDGRPYIEARWMENV